MEKKDKGVCYVTGTEHDIEDLISGADVREAVIDEIQKDHPEFNDHSYISTRSFSNTGSDTWRT
jgi:hypothetical protein